MGVTCRVFFAVLVGPPEDTIRRRVRSWVWQCAPATLAPKVMGRGREALGQSSQISELRFSESPCLKKSGGWQQEDL